MSALAEQHERWTEARKRLVEGPPPEPKRQPERRERRVNPFKRERIAMTIEAIRKRPELAVIYPNLVARVEAGYLPSAFIYLHTLPPAPTWKAIAKEVADKHGVRVADILSPRRDAPTVRARHEAMWRCRNETTYSLPQIGKFLGNRDHTTVLHGIRKHQERMALERANG